MKLPQLNRTIHNWLSIVVALPLAAILGTGVLLHLKKQLPWVQPPEQRGTGGEHALSLPQILDIARSVPHARVVGWDDIQRIDVRPNRGMLKVTTHDRWEIQIDTASGDVLQTAYRRSDLIESIHDGSFFHPWVKTGLFLPTGVLMVVSWVTGLYLFFLPIVLRRRRRAAAR